VSTRDESLFGQARRALGWSFASTLFGRLSLLAIGIVLARVLGPQEFGTFAVAMVALLAVLSFNELGVSLAVVRWPGPSGEIVPTVATLSVVSSTLIYVGCYFGAPTFATAMGEPGAVPVIRVLALSVIVSGLVAAPVGILQRAFRQDRKMIADQVTAWLGSFTSIGLALTGLGAMSLAIGQLVGSVVGAILLIAFAPAGLRLGFNPAKARELLRFGLPLAGSSVVVFASTNVDRLVVGAALGPVALGYYALAVNLANWPVSVFSQPVRAVAPAALARLQSDPPAMRQTFLSTAGLLAAVTLPACALLAAASPLGIRLLYGSEWAQAATVLRWLALLAALRIVFEFAYDYLVVLARSRFLLVLQVVWLVALLAVLYPAAREGGLWAVSMAQFAVALLVVLPLYLFELRRGGIPLQPLAMRFSTALAASVVLAGVAVLADRAIGPDLVALPVVAVAGAAVLGLLLYRMRGVLGHLRGLNSDDASPQSAGPVGPQRTTAGDQASEISLVGEPVPSAGTVQTSLDAVPLWPRGNP
jgi:O-antigen/teichoic acid export membrane protein